jgi:hypothetical protein
MLTGKFSKIKELLDRFEQDNDPGLPGGEYVQFWDIDMMLNWIGSDKWILEHPGLPAFIGFWCDSDLWLYAEIANEFTHRWPGVQPQFDSLTKNSSFSIDRDCWEIYD